MAFEKSQGITFAFGGSQYTATSISISESRGEIDASTVTQADGSYRDIRPSGLVEYSIQCNWIGTETPETKKTAILTIASPADDGLAYPSTSGVGIVSTATAGSFRGTAICTGLSHVAAVGDLIKGSATFKVSAD